MVDLNKEILTNDASEACSPSRFASYHVWEWHCALSTLAPNQPRRGSAFGSVASLGASIQF